MFGLPPPISGLGFGAERVLGLGLQNACSLHFGLRGMESISTPKPPK